MSALTDRIARQQMHVILDRWGTSLSGKRTMTPSRAFEIARHVTEATEAAVRERVARDIEATYLGPDFGRNPITGQDSPHAMHAEAYDEGLSDAARIARGEQ